MNSKDTVPTYRAMRFGRYRLHPTQGLTRGRQEVRLTPKSLAVLCTLVERSGEVVTKDELFQRVWTDTAVSDAALTSCIVELRQALEDDARRPRYIETLHRRGFRFLARPSPEGPAHVATLSTAATLAGSRPIVGREPAVRLLSTALARAGEGTRQVVFVTGEPGIGKTALVGAFLSGIADVEEWRICRADCVEHYGAGEAYLPLLEALTRLCLQADGEHSIAALRQFAPTWLAQLPAVQTPSELAALRRRAAGVTPARMLRELTDALEAMTVHAPIVLCLEDLHWSDASTLDWIDSFARRPEHARVLLIGTYRRGESTNPDRSPEAMANVLRVKGLCTEIGLAGLDQDAVTELLETRVPPAPTDRGWLERLAPLIYRHTEGNPLFLDNVLADLVAQGILVARDGGWTVRDGCEPASLGVPADIRCTIERQIDRLQADERRLLEVAALLGGASSAAAIAAGAGCAVGAVEETLGALARQNVLLRAGGTVEWPDGTVSASFEFLHALYAEVISHRSSPGRRAELHRLIGARLEAAYGDRAPEVAAELAVHFDEARDVPRAVVYLQHAAEIDRRRSAHAGALQHFRRALALLVRLPASAERDEREVALQIGLGNVLMQISGWSAREVEDAYARARALCEARAITPQLFSSLWNLWIFYTSRGRLDIAQALVDRLFELAHQTSDRAMLLQAHHAQWSTRFALGDLRGTEAHAREGMGLYASHPNGPTFAYGSHDAGICARVFCARALALRGRGDAAACMCDEAVALAQELDHPFTLAFTLMHAAAVHQTRGDTIASRDHALAAQQIASDQSFGLMLAWASCFLGWSQVELGETSAGLATLDAGVTRARATGSELFLPHLLGLLGAAQLRDGLFDAAQQSVDEAMAIGDRTGERFHLAELHRLQGELRLAMNDDADARRLAEADFRTAISIAEEQGALQPASWAAVSLARL